MHSGKSTVFYLLSRRALARRLAKNEGELLDCDDAIFLTSSDSAASALPGYAQEEQEMLRARKLRLNPLNPPALRMTSYWRLWSVKNLKIVNKPPGRVSLPFLPNAKVEKEWKKPFFLTFIGFSILVMLTL